MSSSKDEFKMFTYLGQKIKNPYLRESACMNENLREFIGAIYSFTVLTGDKTFLEFVEAIKVLARFTWARMEVTDLSLMLGENITHVNFENAESRSDDSIQEDSEEDL